jgi:hypothetical protein
MRIPPVRRFWVIVANLPPPVPRKMSSSGEVAKVMFVFRHRKVCVWRLICFPLFSDILDMVLCRERNMKGCVGGECKLYVLMGLT